MSHQRPMLEPVLENYMGPSPISYDIPRHGRSGRTAKVAPSSAAQEKHFNSGKANPSNIFGRLRDRYIKAMNEMAMGGDYAAVAGYHGCVPGPETYSAVHHRSDERRREIEALRADFAGGERR